MGEKGRRTRQAICQSACQLFAEKGFKDVTMKDICERTHLSRGGLYRHYGSTREIFIEIVDSLMRQQADDFGGKMEQGVPAGDILDEVLKRYESEMADAGSSLSVALYEFFSSPEYSGDDHSMYEQYLSLIHISYFLKTTCPVNLNSLQYIHGNHLKPCDKDCHKISQLLPEINNSDTVR